VTKALTGIACAYCGERHDDAAQVRRCWQRAQERAAPAPVPPARTLDGPAAPGAPIAPVLGRSVLVKPGQEPPAAWSKCRRASGGTEELEQAWREREPLVIELAEQPPDDEVERRPVWSLAPSFAFPGERRAHAMFANSVDARDIDARDIDARQAGARWPLADVAVRLGAARGGPADVVLPDGRPAFCDGGPLEWRASLDGAAVISRLALLGGSLAPFGPNRTAAQLAPDQLAAVLDPGGAARIIAPAGSGKTRVLTERARHVLRAWGLPGQALTLVAFNKRAADEMKERTPDLMELQVRTLNALGLSVLSKSRAVTTIDEREVRSLLGTLVHLPHRANTDPAAAWIEALSAVRLGLQSPAKVEAELDGDVDGLAEVLVRYRRALADRQVVDFDEQVYGAIELLLADPAARRSARASCRMLLVDELQDLTPAHLLLIRLLAGPEGAVFGVGDDDQTIYGYAGASPEWLIGYKRFFPTATEHALEVNYRCPVSVVDAARALLTHNRHRVDKRIVAAPGRASADGELEVIATGDALAATTDVVAGLVGRDANPSDIAVLTRVNASLAPVQVALVHMGIPVRRAIDASYLDRSGIQAALAWLRLATAAPGRLSGPDIALAARKPSRALAPKVVEWMSEQADVAGIQRLARRLNARDGTKVGEFVSDLHLVRRRCSSGTAAILRAVRDDIGLDRAMELLEGSRRRLDRSAQTDDLGSLVALAVLHPEADGFEEWLRKSLSRPGSLDGVVLSTVHRVKGRQWPHVVLHEVSAGLIPHRLAIDVEEERRVFHVGLTRGSSSVHVVAGEEPSPFLAELTEPWAPGRPPASEVRPDAAGAARGREVGGREVGRREVGRREVGRREVPPRRAGGRPRPGHPPTTEVPTTEVPTTEVPTTEVVDRARQALRTWRSKRAAEDGKPPFIYLHDRTVDALAASMPASMAALATVPGIGPAKLESYGDELLAVLEAARGPQV